MTKLRKQRVDTRVADMRTVKLLLRRLGCFLEASWGSYLKIFCSFDSTFVFSLKLFFFDSKYFLPHIDLIFLRTSSKSGWRKSPQEAGRVRPLTLAPAPALALALAPALSLAHTVRC